jgi:hypothetical protein
VLRLRRAEVTAEIRGAVVKKEGRVVKKCKTVLEKRKMVIGTNQFTLTSFLPRTAPVSIDLYPALLYLIGASLPSKGFRVPFSTVGLPQSHWLSDKGIPQITHGIQELSCVLGQSPSEWQEFS